VVSLRLHVFMYIFFLFYFLLGLVNMGFYYLIQIKIGLDWIRCPKSGVDTTSLLGLIIIGWGEPGRPKTFE